MFHEKQTAGSSDESDSIVAERNTEHEIFYVYFNNIYSGLKRYLDTFLDVKPNELTTFQRCLKKFILDFTIIQNTVPCRLGK